MTAQNKSNEEDSEEENVMTKYLCIYSFASVKLENMAVEIFSTKLSVSYDSEQKGY